MRGRFARPVRIGGKLYECGEHEIDAALAAHWYFKALVKDGLAQIIEDPKPEPAPAPASAMETKVKPVVTAAAPKPAPKPTPKPVQAAKKKTTGKK